MANEDVISEHTVTGFIEVQPPDGSDLIEVSYEVVIAPTGDSCGLDWDEDDQGDDFDWESFEGAASEAAYEDAYKKVREEEEASSSLLAACEGVLRSAGYESGLAEPTLRELSVGREYMDALRTAVAKVKGGAK